MSQSSSMRRAGTLPETQRTAKLTIKNIKNTSVNLFAKILDETPDYVENTLLPALRFEIRKVDPEPLEKGPLKSGEEVLCMPGENPQYFMYGTDEMTRRTVHIRHKFRKEFIKLFPFDTLGGMETNADGERVYRPDYAELDRVVIYMMSHERTRMINNDKLRTNDGDKEFTPRTRHANDLMAPEEEEDDDETEPSPAAQRQPLIRSKLIIHWGDEGEYIQVKFTDFYDEDALKELRKKKGGGDLKADFFSCSKLWELLGRRKLYESVGFLRTVVDPPMQELPDHIDLDGTIDEVLQDDDNKLKLIMKCFRYQSKHLLAQKFEMSFINHPPERRQRKRTRQLENNGNDNSVRGRMRG